MLIIFGGLPGTGKTTISKKLAELISAVYLRVDSVEQAIKNVSKNFEGPEGYEVCYAIARDNLKLGLQVIADSVNPISITRDQWKKVADDTKADILEIELICSNAKEHQNRIESRTADIPGHQLPTWNDVLTRDYDPWYSKSITIDTSEHSTEEVLDRIMGLIRAKLEKFRE